MQRLMRNSALVDLICHADLGPKIKPTLRSDIYLGGYQNYGPFLGTLNIRGRIIIGTQKGTIILKTTHLISNTKP